jgi:hypothetical protein
MGRISVSTFWAGRPLSNYEILSLKTWARAGYEVNLYSYDPIQFNSPNIFNLDAREILPETFLFENQNYKGTFAPFANIFRYKLLATKDTTWIDTDMLLLKDELPDSPWIMCFESPGRINNAIMRIPIESGISAYLFEKAMSKNLKNLYWGEIGPDLLTEVIFENKLQSRVSNTEAYFPIHVTEAWKPFHPAEKENLAKIISNSYTIHLYNEMMRREDPFKSIQPAIGSWIRDKFEEYEIDNWESFTLNPEWARQVLENPRSFLKNHIDSLVSERDSLVSERDSLVSERDSLVSERDSLVSERDSLVSERDAAKAIKNQLTIEIAKILSSRSWKLAISLQKIYRLFR